MTTPPTGIFQENEALLDGGIVFPSTWERELRDLVVRFDLGQDFVDMIEEELHQFRWERDTHALVWIAETLPDMEARVEALQAQIAAYKAQMKVVEGETAQLQEGVKEGTVKLIAWIESKHRWDSLHSKYMDVWHELAPIMADVSSMKAHRDKLLQEWTFEDDQDGNVTDSAA